MAKKSTKGKKLLKAQKPSKTDNYVFANARRDAQNFMVKCYTDCEVRRVMSASQIPNL